MTEQNTTLDKNSLKVEALTQRIAALVSQYENQMADFRAESTIVIEQLQRQIQELQQQVASQPQTVEDVITLDEADYVVSEEASDGE